jgi:hypothetical protein
MPAHSPDDLPDETSIDIEWERDHSGAGQDPDAVAVVLGKYEWRSLSKRPRSEFTVDGVTVSVSRGASQAALDIETDRGDVTGVDLKLTAAQYRSLREHGRITFTAERTFAFDVTVVRRE